MAVVVVGINSDILVNLSTTTKIALWTTPVSLAVDMGSSPMKSADIDSHGRSGIGNCLSSP